MTGELPAAVFRLVLLLILTPFYIHLLRGTPSTPGRKLFIAAYFAVVASFAASALEFGSTAPYPDTLEHVSIAAAGALSLAGVIRARHMVKEGRDAA